MTGTLIHRCTAVGSTQDEAHRLAESGAPHGSAVVAPVQTSGRGTRGRSWISEPGGLWLSVVCRPGQGSGIESLGLRTGIVLAEVLQGVLSPGMRVTLKWPNDLIIADAKVGGILAEARWLGETLSWVVVGVGINVANAVPSGQRFPATSLAAHGASVSAEQLAEPVVNAVARATEMAPPLTPAELEAFRSRDWLRGRRILLPHPGVAHGITSDGRLQVLTPQGAVVESGDTVELAPPG